jgi:excisionase family DNA binding protein
MMLLTVKDIARILTISQSKAYKLAESGQILSIKIGRSLRFHPEQVNDFIARKTKEKQNDKL